LIGGSNSVLSTSVSNGSSDGPWVTASIVASGVGINVKGDLDLARAGGVSGVLGSWDEDSNVSSVAVALGLDQLWARLESKFRRP